MFFLLSFFLNSNLSHKNKTKNPHKPKTAAAAMGYLGILFKYQWHMIAREGAFYSCKNIYIYIFFLTVHNL